MDSDSYQLVPYDNFPLPQTNPSRLHAVATLAGVFAPPIDSCRVLELGTNEGANLIPMAHRFRHAEFVGVDLEPEPIERGRSAAKEFGLRNLRLEAMNVLDIDASFGTFDYIIAHGLYSWSPAAVGDKVLAIMGQMLSTNGIGFVSYNTQPAGHIRMLMREMMQFHARAVENPVERLVKAREFLAIVARERSPQELQNMDAYDAVLAASATELLTRSDSSLMHDDLSSAYQPVSLSDFAAQASRHGLQYLDDAASPDPRGSAPVKGFDARTASQLRAMAGGDRIAELQYHDYLRMRRFRQSIVCRAGLAPQLGGSRSIGLHASTRLKDIGSDTFSGVEGSRISIGHAAALSYLRGLIGLWPESARVSADEAGVAEALFRAGAIELHGDPSHAARASERPRVDELILQQLNRGDSVVSTLLHEPLQIDEEMRVLLPLLDGTRDCSDVAGALGTNAGMVREQVNELAMLGVFTRTIGNR
jgi:SAM-dependent methyltransferase